MKSFESVPDLFGLKVYGEKDSSKLYNRKVAGYLAALNIVLLLQFMFDWWAWSRTWIFCIGEQFGGFLIAPVLGIILAGAILLFDRAIITGDSRNRGQIGSWWNRNSGYLFRLGMILLLAGVTSVAVELSVFQPDINREINQAERLAVDKVRADAIALETKRFDELAKLTTEGSTKTINKDVALAQQAIDEYTARRAAVRGQILKDQATKRADHQQLLKTAADKAVSEAAGKYSHREGVGPLTREARRQETDAAKRLREFEADATAERAAFDAETEAEVKRLTEVRDNRNASGVSGLNAATTTLLAKKQDKIRTIEAMNGPALTAAGYAGDWEQSRGFMARYHVLHQLTAQVGSANWFVMWGCRVLMIVFGLLVLGLKIFAPEEFNLYYSLGHQARVDQRDAATAVVAKGLNAQTYGMDDYVRQKLEQLMEKRAELASKIHELSQMTLDWAMPNPRGRCAQFEEIVANRQRFWETSGAALQVEVAQAEDRLHNMGIAVPAWPANLNYGNDVRRQAMPWAITKGVLKDSYGWVDPEPNIARAKQYCDDIVVAYADLQTTIHEGEQQLEHMIDVNPYDDVQACSRMLKLFFRKKIEPIVQKISGLERKIAELGGTVPEWPRDFPDPRSDLRQWFTEIDESRLKRLGWVGTDELLREDTSTSSTLVSTSAASPPPPPPHLVAK